MLSAIFKNIVSQWQKVLAQGHEEFRGFSLCQICAFAIMNSEDLYKKCDNSDADCWESQELIKIKIDYWA